MAKTVIVDEDAEARIVERRMLIAELPQDAIDHLSTCSLQLMAVEAAANLGRAKALSRAAADSTASALAELRLLLKLVAEEVGAPSAANAVADLGARSSPTQVGSSTAHALEQAGFWVEVTLPASLDRLQHSVRRTIVLCLTEAADRLVDLPSEIGCAARYFVRAAVTDGEARLAIAVAGVRPKAVIERLSAGLAQRVALTDGVCAVTLRADALWIDVVLPTAQQRIAPSTDSDARRPLD